MSSCQAHRASGQKLLNHNIGKKAYRIYLAVRSLHIGKRERKKESGEEERGQESTWLGCEKVFSPEK